jgi:hypothetical protein
MMYEVMFHSHADRVESARGEMGWKRKSGSERDDTKIGTQKEQWWMCRICWRGMDFTV